MGKRPLNPRTIQQHNKAGASDRLRFERELYAGGARLIAGVDEAGRGPLAGPVVAAAVILPKDFCHPDIRDSKRLTSKQRDRFFDEIINTAIAWNAGLVDSLEIDSINIHRASLKAMRVAVEGLRFQPDRLLIDGKFCIESKIPQKTIVNGDDISLTIAAASIIAKVTRDRMMCDFERVYPAFGFSVHKGYGTRAHLCEIKIHGPTPIHRMTFHGVLGDQCYAKEDV